MGVEPEEAGDIYSPPALLLALKTSPTSATHWERREALQEGVDCQGPRYKLELGEPRSCSKKMTRTSGGIAGSDQVLYTLN